MGGTAPYHAEYRPLRPDGQHRWLSASGRVTLDTQGKVVFMLGAVVDVTERRDAEEGLRRTNAELEEFASVASHDLQEPLRQVAIFSQLVQQKYIHQIDAEADEYLNYCVGGARRMSALIDDLLTYSRTARADHVLTHPVDLNDVLAQVSETLTMRVKECGATLEISTLPTVKGHAGLLNQLWQNLLANALRYRGEAAPRIRVTADQQGTYWTFAVADNGIGISPEYHEQIFRIFQRLHDRETYSGTGIGLAICKKIVERHGGRIWVESEPGHGATFRFTLTAC
jgi:light-regulated signal transduction histidine kinase (bacteriophytochrome)